MDLLHLQPVVVPLEAAMVQIDSLPCSSGMLGGDMHPGLDSSDSIAHQPRVVPLHEGAPLSPATKDEDLLDY
jgi:hypothetical protein